MTDWPQLVQEHGPMVWRTTYRLLNNEADAADCFQRTFVAALELARTQTVRNWPAFLNRLATLRALECLRQKRRDARRHISLSEGAPADARAINPLQAAETGELAEHLRQALAELDQRQAQVFCLACLEDLSYRQIAAQLGLSVSHVGVLLNRARACLRNLLEAYRWYPAPSAWEERSSHECG
jgi:RNA polymerase sigma-70 factor (ECF subfamily)